MSKKNKKAQSSPTAQISPLKYLRTKARNLPFGNCYINDNWALTGVSQIFITRVMPSGKYILGIYLVDTQCLGLKNTTFQFALDEGQYQELLENSTERTQLENELASPILLQNIIYGAIEYAESLGFKPDPNFELTEYILDPADKIPFIDIEFGKDGKPLYIQGNYDNAAQILKQLDRNVGKGNYNFLSHAEILANKNQNLFLEDVAEEEK